MCHNVVEELENNELEKKKNGTFSDSLNLKPLETIKPGVL